MKDTLDGYKEWLLDKGCIMKLGYKEWLLDIMIRCGVGVIRDTDFPWDYMQKASHLGHIVYGDDEDFNFIAYTLTPTAANYLKENE
jgi:hypothetical protein